jgi:hypothetical protein
MTTHYTIRAREFQARPTSLGEVETASPAEFCHVRGHRVATVLLATGRISSQPVTFKVGLGHSLLTDQSDSQASRPPSTWETLQRSLNGVGDGDSAPVRTPQKCAGETASRNGRRFVGDTLTPPKFSDRTRSGPEEDRWADVLLAEDQLRPEAVPLEEIEPVLAAVVVAPSPAGNRIEKCDNEGVAARPDDSRKFRDRRILLIRFEVMNNGDGGSHLRAGGTHRQGCG